MQLLFVFFHGHIVHTSGRTLAHDIRLAKHQHALKTDTLQWSSDTLHLSRDKWNENILSLG